MHTQNDKENRWKYEKLKGMEDRVRKSNINVAPERGETGAEYLKT